MIFFSRYSFPLVVSIFIGFCFLLFYVFFYKAPSSFPSGQLFVIPRGLTLRESAKLLEEGHIITSPKIFSIVSSILSDEKVIAGSYFFEKPISVFSVARRTAVGDYHVKLIRVVFFEGTNTFEMADTCARVLVGCNKDDFLRAARGKEGYLFPDTYFLLASARGEEVVTALDNNFNKRTEGFFEKANKFGKSFEDVLIMASIVEAEAKNSIDRKTVAGILWKRLQINMPLQVDSAFKYVNGKTTFDLSLDDLKVDSPYNTYTNKGLPPTPINNPGLGAIEDTMLPIKTPYLYYLTGKDGKFYYAITHEEHVRNKKQYLR